VLAAEVSIANSVRNDVTWNEGPVEASIREALAAVPPKLDTLLTVSLADEGQHERAIALARVAEQWRLARLSERPTAATREPRRDASTGDGHVRNLVQALTSFAAMEEQSYRRHVSDENAGHRRTLFLLLGEIAFAAGLALYMWRHLRRHSAALATQRAHLEAQNLVLASQRDQLLEQHEEMETQATELEIQAVELQEHAADLEIVNTELADAMTALRASSASLAESEARYRYLFEHNPWPMWVYDSQSLSIMAVNESAISAYGYTRDEFLRMTIEELRPAEDVARMRSAAAVARAMPGLHHADGWRHRRKDGSIVDVDIASHATDFDGRPARIVLALDITARRAAECELVRSRDLLRALIDGSPLAIIALDRDLKIQRWNPAATQLLGGSEEERIGTSYTTLVPPDRLAEHNRLRVGIFRGHVETNLDTQRLRLDGTLADVAISLAALRDSEGSLSGIVVVMADASERRKLEAQLRQSQKLEAVGQLAGGIAHDFNNLLTVILSYSQMLLSDLPAASPAVADVREIEGAAGRAASLTRQLLAFSRQQILRPAPMAVNDVIANLQKLLRRLVPEDIAIDTAQDAQVDIIEADAGQIEQVLVNLVVNARDAMPTGGAVFIGTRNIDILDGSGPLSHDGTPIPQGQYVVLEVRDSGSGMAPETMARMWEPFFTTKETGKGTGLGLSTVHGIVKQSGAHVVVRSGLEWGTSICVYFPVYHGAPRPTPDAMTEHAVHATGERVLLVEDDTALRNIASRVLNRAGYDVRMAHNGREALAMLDAGAAFDLVIADMVMPEMSGGQLVAILRERYPAVRLVLMSGYTPDVLMRRGLASDAMAFLEKPFTPDQLAAIVRRVLDEKAA
jgi:PAS domain S-box-containing protein